MDSDICAGVHQRLQVGPREVVADPMHGDVELCPQPPRQKHRHDRRASPSGELVDVQREPVRQEDQFRRQDRHAAPVPLPEERQPDLREDSRFWHAAGGEYKISSSPHRRCVRRYARELKREVCLDRRIDIGRPPIVDRPSAIGDLLPLYVRGYLAPTRLVFRTQKVRKQQVLGRNANVCLQLAGPVSVRVLGAQEVVLRAA